MDMLIKLFDLPPSKALATVLNGRSISVRRAMSYERSLTIDWVKAQFNDLWADECAVAFGRQPVGCHIAVADNEIIGFCCVDATFRNFIGPIGMADQWRGLGIGGALALSALWELRINGYAYAIVGDVGQPEFFMKTAGAVEIAGSAPGPYPPKVKPSQ